MTPAPLPPQEADRLRALRELLILDTPPEERFDRIVQFAAAEFDVPMALVSLVDADRQWFKARVGFDRCESGRNVSFCSHAILAPNVLLVGDASRDERFVDNPLVTGAPHIRFYAGAPLCLPTGQVVGTLCILDARPRTLDAVEIVILQSLRDLVVTELTAHGDRA